MIVRGLAAAFLIVGVPAAAQRHEHAGAPAVEAVAPGQAFERGLYLLHNFEYERARVAFRLAQQHEPNNVLGYWGEAMTHNHPLWMYVGLDEGRAILARLGPNPAARIAKARNDEERGLMEAIEALFGPGTTKAQRDQLYHERMMALHRAMPDNIDVRALTALSFMGLAHEGRDISLYMRAAAMLEEAYPSHPRHPGLLHYMIHAYDDPVHAPLGLRAARTYGEVARDAGHAMHMTSHIHLALGDWKGVEQANVQAMVTVDGQRAAAGKSRTFCGHYNEWLAYALLQQGKDAGPLVAGCRTEALAQLGADDGTRKLGPPRSLLASYADMAARVAVETGAAPEALPPGDGSLLGRFWLAYAGAVAWRSPDAARAAAAAEVERLAGPLLAAKTEETPNDRSGPRWVERARAQVRTLSLVRAGKAAEAIAALREAARIEASLPVEFGPPALPKPSAELLGDLALAAGDRVGAAEAYRAALAAAPGRRLAAHGLATASSDRVAQTAR